jgi:pimeloyl-ACP methyl ester carboxylesterase
MSSPQRRSIDRRSFIATSMAAGAFALLARGASAASSLAEPLRSAVPDAIDLSRATRNEGDTEMINQATAAQTSKPTVVLVHGAFAESASWNGVASRLLDQGYPVVAVANPLRGVTVDADYTAGVLKSIAGPIVLVGHSYGGMVISKAATGNGNIVGLVFVAGFAPEEGEQAGELTARFPGSTLGPTLTPPIGLPDGGSDVAIQQDKFWVQFAADVPEAEAKVMAATQRPASLAAFTEPAGPPAWKTIPSRFIYGEMDKNIPAALQAFMAERAGSQETVEVMGASHVVMVSHPDAVAAMIVNAAVARTPAASAA